MVYKLPRNVQRKKFRKVILATLAMSSDERQLANAGSVPRPNVQALDMIPPVFIRDTK